MPKKKESKELARSEPSRADSLLEEMERQGFFKLTFIKTSKVSESKFNYQSIQSGYVIYPQSGLSGPCHHYC